MKVWYFYSILQYLDMNEQAIIIISLLMNHHIMRDFISL